MALHCATSNVSISFHKLKASLFSSVGQKLLPFVYFLNLESLRQNFYSMISLSVIFNLLSSLSNQDYLSSSVLLFVLST